MKIKSAEQYKALRKRALAKKHKRNRKDKRSDQRTAAERLLKAVFGTPTFNAPPMTNEKRAVRITDVFSKAAIGCPQSRNLESHYAHPMPNDAGMCPGYLRTREDHEYTEGHTHVTIKGADNA